ncbi:MAG TPA: hypothetical protein VG796_00310 [Verrucomicrobiales bacterium]|nr:hypothetical protein [Verrucomicrobiales bacterium]
MKIRPAALCLSVFAAAAFFGAGVFAERHWLSDRLDGGKQMAEETAQVPARLKRFRAVTKFLISQPPAATDGSSLDWLEREFKTLTSHEVLKSVVRRLNFETKWGVAPSEAAARLERMVETELERGTDIASVSAWSVDREEAVQIADAVRLAYEEQRQNQAEDAVALQRRVREQIERQTSKVETARLEMMEVMKRNNIVDFTPLSAGVLTPPANQPATPAAHSAKDLRERQAEYGNAKYSYESQFQLLNAMKAHARNTEAQPLVPTRKPVELLQPARVVEPK